MAPRSGWDQQYEEPPKSRGGCFWALVFLVLAIGLVVGLMVAFPNAPDVKSDMPRLVYLVALLSVLLVSVGTTFAQNPGRTARHVAIWIAIASGTSLLYAFRGEFGEARDRVVGSAMPAQGVATETPKERTVTLYAQGGHFFVEAEVEGKKVMFMVDTGATDVALTKDDAQRLGITPPERAYTRVYSTANGQSRGAPVTFDSIAIGPIDVRYVDGSVVEGQMQVSLLGMSFLNRLAGYQVVGDRLVLRQ